MVSPAYIVPPPPPDVTFNDALHWASVLRAHLTIVRREIETELWSDHPYSRHRLRDLQSREAGLAEQLEALGVSR
jgi:hypothetical protein